MILKALSERTPEKQKPAGALALLLALLPPAFLAWFIYRFGVDVPFADQWDFVPLLDQLYSGRLTFEALISQHNEHRFLFPKMIMLALAYWSDWNVLWEMGVNYLICLRHVWGTSFPGSPALSGVRFSHPQRTGVGDLTFHCLDKATRQLALGMADLSLPQYLCRRHRDLAVELPAD